jgi:hypothetical protein
MSACASRSVACLFLSGNDLCLAGLLQALAHRYEKAAQLVQKTSPLEQPAPTGCSRFPLKLTEPGLAQFLFHTLVHQALVAIKVCVGHAATSFTISPDGQVPSAIDQV